MKLTTIATFVVAIGVELALASPVAQQAPVKHHLMAKDLNNILAPGPNPCANPAVCNSDPKPEPKPEPAPPPPAPEPEPPKNELCFKTPPSGLGGLTAETVPCPTPVVETKNRLCFDPAVTGLDRLTAATVPCDGGGGGVVTQASDGQVQAPVSATGNPVSTIAGKAAADIVGPTVSPTESISPATATGKSDSSLPAETGSSTESTTQASTTIPTTDPVSSILPIETTASSQTETDASIPGYSFETVFTDPILPTLAGPTHTTRPHHSRPCKHPFKCHPQGSHDPHPRPTRTYIDDWDPKATDIPGDSSHWPYPTGTYIGDWDPKVTPLSSEIPGDSSHLPYPTGTYIGDWDPKVTPLSSEGPIRPGVSHSLPHLPWQTFPSWIDEKRAFGKPGHGPLRIREEPTTLATVVIQDKSVKESTSVHHIGPGWSHSLAHQPFPTEEMTAPEVPLPTEETIAAELTSVHHVGPGWSHSLAHQPFPTPTLEKKSPEEPIRPGKDHSIAWRPLPTPRIVKKTSLEEPIRPGKDHSIAWRPLPTPPLEKKSPEDPPTVHRVRPGQEHSLAWRPLPTN